MSELGEPGSEEAKSCLDRKELRGESALSLAVIAVALGN